MLYKGFEIELIQDDDMFETPRDWSNTGTCLFFGRYSHLGDDHNLRTEDYSCEEELLEEIIKRYEPVEVMRVYGYSHSGLTISIKPFNDVWDSGLLGFILVEKKRIEELGWKRISSKRRNTLKEYMTGEIAVLNQYVSGDVWFYNVTDEDDEVVDSCGGIYGYEYALEMAKEFVDSII